MEKSILLSVRFDFEFEDRNIKIYSQLFAQMSQSFCECYTLDFIDI